MNKNQKNEIYDHLLQGTNRENNDLVRITKNQNKISYPLSTGNKAHNYKNVMSCFSDSNKS